MHEVSIVDYGVGNIKAYLHVYEKLNISANAVSTSKELLAAKRLILPGVGSFDWAMERLQKSGLRDALDTAVLKNGMPVFGVCVGMQMMAERSEEGAGKGLGWIPAEVVRMRPMRNQPLPLPHMGWNDASQTMPHKLLDGIDRPKFYFLHSFAVELSEQSDQLASTVYGYEFTSAIARKNILATQFHPEKSHRWGGALLKNFSSI